MKKQPVALPLCYRCHHRARYLETGGQWCPRMECGQVDQAVCGCYMYRPPAPLLLISEKGDRRPVGGPWMFSARLHAVEEVQGCWTLQRVGRGWSMGWEGDAGGR